MKRLIAILLVFVFTFNSIGYYCIFRIFQYQIRSEIKLRIKQRISPDKLHEISLLKSELHQLEWERHGKEFRYQGMMYNVVSMKETSTTVIYYCITDKEETQLFAMLDLLVKESMAHSKKHNLIKKLLSHLYKAFYENGTTLCMHLFYNRIQPYALLNPFFVSLPQDIPVPPPKQVQCMASLII